MPQYGTAQEQWHTKYKTQALRATDIKHFHFPFSRIGFKWVRFASTFFWASVMVWHCTQAAEFGEGTVNLAVEHVLVTDDFEQGVAVG